MNIAIKNFLPRAFFLGKSRKYKSMNIEGV